MAYVSGPFNFGALLPASGYGYQGAAAPNAAYLTQTYGQGIADFLNQQRAAMEAAYRPYGEDFPQTLPLGEALRFGGGTWQNQQGVGGGWRASPEALQYAFQQVGALNDPQVQQYLQWAMNEQPQAAAWDENYVDANQSGLSKLMGIAIPAATLGVFGAGAAGLLGGAAGGAGSAAGATIPELGLIATPATAEAAIAGGIAPSMLAGGPGAITLGSLGEQGMGFFDSLLGGDASWGVNPQTGFDLGGWENYGIYDPMGGGDYSWVDSLGSAFGDTGTFYPIEGTIPGIDPASWGSYLPGGADLSWWQGIQNALPSIPGMGGSSNQLSTLGSLFGGGGGQQEGGLGSFLGGLFGGSGGLGGLLGNAVSLAPILGGLAYAANQTGFDTSRLENLYNQYNPQASTLEYDLNTAAGRNRLTSNLGRRGVLGSSFGNFDVASYNTLRDLGRQNLINQAVTPAAGIAGQILNANVAERALKNELYGRGLSALGLALSPRNVSFGYTG